MIDTTKITDITIIFVEKSLIKNPTMNGKQKINVLIIAVVNIISDDFLVIFLFLLIIKLNNKYLVDSYYLILFEAFAFTISLGICIKQARGY